MLMVQSKPTVTVKSSKLKPPPPVPPRPNQNIVAEALAKTRKVVAESKITKPRSSKDEQKAKTLDRTNVAGTSPQNTSPKLNGLARVKSFIRDVISDRSSSEDKKSISNSRRSSVDAQSSPASAKSSPEQKSTGKTIKSCRQALVRSLSTSTKTEQESKGRVLKSSSFADKSLPIRKAPPPPLSPKPKLREIKPVTAPKRNSLEIKLRPKVIPTISSRPPASPVKPPTVPATDINETNTVTNTEAPYATVDEVTDFDSRLSCSSEPRQPTPVENVKPDLTQQCTEPPDQYTTTLERKTSRVTERLISEIIASKNKPKDNVDKNKNDDIVCNGGVATEGVKNFKDMNNHEILIYELQSMRSQTEIPKCKDEEATELLNGELDNDKCSSGKSSPSPSCDFSETSELSASADPYKCEVDDPLTSRLRKQFRAISSMSLQGLPPLPKSLSGFAEGPLSREEDSDSSTSPEAIKPGDMEGQLAHLKREMASLRRLDLSLLSELWSLNESMASWRQQLERTPRLRPAPPPPPHYLRT